MGKMSSSSSNILCQMFAAEAAKKLAAVKSLVMDLLVNLL